MRVLEGIGNSVLVAMAAASLMSMIAAYSADMIVNGDLYSYGLVFDHGWHAPFETAIRVVFIMAWVSIIIAIVFQVYRIVTIRKDELEEPE